MTSKTIFQKLRPIIFTLILLPIFFNERFTGGWISVGVYVILISIGIGSLIFYGNKKWNIHPILSLGILLLLEISIYASFFLIKNGWVNSKNIQQGYHHFYTTYLRNIPTYQTDLGEYDKDLFYTLKSGKNINRNFEFTNAYQVNSQGLRDDEQSLRNPEYIVLGDSHAMGFGVAQEETFAQIIESKLEKKVLNSAIISYGTARQYLLSQRLNLEACKTIIWQYCPNDAYENECFLKNGNELKISSEQEYRFCQHRNFLQANYYPFKYTFETFAHQLRKLAFWKNQKPPVLSIQKQTENFFKIVQLLRKDFKGEVIVLNLESKNTNGDLINEFEKYIAQNNLVKISCIDFSTILNENDFNVIDEHLNKNGHQKIGEKLYEWITTEDNYKGSPLLSSQN